MAKVYATPGVYIEEKSAFPNSAVPVATAVPAFIGYTEMAIRDKKDLTNVPTRISSLGEYHLYFGEAPETIYTLTEDPDPLKIYKLANAGRFFLYYSMRLFFANGGSDCYIVSVGKYDEKASKKEDFLDEGKGISTLLKEPEPTMVVIPDAMRFGGENVYADIQNAMLKHCAKTGSRFSILDVFINQEVEDSTTTRERAEQYRNDLGKSLFLQWGAVYYPWLETNIVGPESVNFTNLTAESIDPLKKILKAQIDPKLEAPRKTAIETEVDKLALPASKTPEELAKVDDLHQTLLTISPMYKSIMNSTRAKINLLPPSGGLAGIYCMVDNNVGVFQSPANINVGSVIKPSINITHDEQEDLNLPLNGMAINAIRTFPGKGVLVWGARTLDGNSGDWKYISVRRTVIFIEQSIKNAAEPYVFAPNTAPTWTNMKALITNFLINVWQSGALAGAVPEHAFSVDVGLGTTMTPIDILDGVMRITVKIAVTRPAEFIVITFQQKMQES